MFSWWKSYRVPVIVGHRGASALAPENTLASIEKAIACGVDAVEIDIRLSSDGAVVVIHDARLQRTTDGKGKVRDLTVDELKRVSAGKWFSRKFSDEKIPTLDEVMKYINGRVGLNVEIKAERMKNQSMEIVDRCINCIRRYNVFDSVMVSSFNYSFLNYARSIESRLCIGILHRPIISDTAGILIQVVKRIKPQYFIYRHNRLSASRLFRLRQMSLKVGVYTINQVYDFVRMKEFGVDAIYTDNPQLIKIKQK